MSNLRRWLEWTPTENNLSDPRPSKPPKPAKPLHEVGFAGFAGFGGRGDSKTFLPETAHPDPKATLSLVRKGQAVCLASDLLGVVRVELFALPEGEAPDFVQSVDTPPYDFAFTAPALDAAERTRALTLEARA